MQNALARVAEAKSSYAPNLFFGQNSYRVFQIPSESLLGDVLQSGSDLLTALPGWLLGLDGTDDNDAFSEHASFLSLVWVAFDGFARDAQLGAAVSLRDAAIWAQSDAERLLVSAVDRAFFEIQSAHERQRIAEADHSFSREQLMETEKLRAAGRASQADVDHFKLRSLKAEVAAATALSLRETGRTVLAELMGLEDTLLPPDIQLEPLGEESQVEMSPPDPAAWIASAVERRPDVIRLEHLVQAEEARCRAAQGAYSPTVAVGAGWGFSRSENLRYEDGDQVSAAGIGLQWEIYSGGRRQAKVLQAESGLAEARAALKGRRQAVIAEVRQANIELVDAQRQIPLHRAALETARENRRAVQAAYAAGKESLSRMNEAVRDYLAAEVDMAQARIRLRQSWSKLKTVAGSTGIDSH